MKNERITNKEKVRQALDRAGHRLSINEVLHLTGLTKAQVRGVANYYSSDIVPVGGGKIDLITRAYKGRGLRVAPTKDDIKAGIIHSDELFVYLWSVMHSLREVTLLSEDGINFKPKREYGLSTPQSVISGFSKWYKLTDFQAGDDIIFRCRDLKDREFEITRLPLQKRNKKEISYQNNILGEIIYDILNHSINKCEQVHFLALNYLLKDPYLDEILPDQLMQVININPYLFIYEKRLQKMSYFGVGIKKYFHYHKGTCHVVSVVKDEMIGKYGYCMECQSFMKWNEKQDWKPAGEDEYFDITLNSSFFKRK